MQYGYQDTNLADYEEDHLIPLEIGGDGYAPANLWPEPYAGTGARVKDTLENQLKVLGIPVRGDRLLCRTQLELPAADAYQRYVLGQ